MLDIPLLDIAVCTSVVEFHLIAFEFRWRFSLLAYWGVIAVTLDLGTPLRNLDSLLYS